MSPRLSIVVPVYNEAKLIPATVRAAGDAVAECNGLDAELVVVDDGSTDRSADAARSAAGSLALRVIEQPNRGRFEARLAGLQAAAGEHVLFLDSRVRLLPGSLPYVAGRLGEVWNAHVVIETSGNPYAQFWNVLTELAFAEYFSNPRETTFDAESFDRFPKGTTCFLAPRGLLLEAFDRFDSYYADPRHANDDTSLIRWIAAQRPIHISPSFACLYPARTTLTAFFRHARHRGVVFLDGHARPDSRFFPAAVGFFPASAAAALLAVRRPLAGALLPAAIGGAAAVVARRAGRRREETASFALLAPVYALGHALGMWEGLGLALAKALRRRT